MLIVAKRMTIATIVWGLSQLQTRAPIQTPFFHQSHCLLKQCQAPDAARLWKRCLRLASI